MIPTILNEIYRPSNFTVHKCVQNIFEYIRRYCVHNIHAIYVTMQKALIISVYVPAAMLQK